MRLLLALFLFLTPLSAADWGPLDFLIGKWTGEGSGGPGQSGGSFTFLPDLQNKILVRKSFAAYPPANGKPGFRHDDLLIVYRDDAHELRAIYFDSEEHTIPYGVKAAPGGVVFESAAGSPGPRYRMTYTAAGTARARFKFEIAPPGKDFATYIEANLRKE